MKKSLNAFFSLEDSTYNKNYTATRNYAMLALKYQFSRVHVKTLNLCSERPK